MLSDGDTLCEASHDRHRSEPSPSPLVIQRDSLDDMEASMMDFDDPSSQDKQQMMPADSLSAHSVVQTRLRSGGRLPSRRHAGGRDSPNTELLTTMVKQVSIRSPTVSPSISPRSHTRSGPGDDDEESTASNLLIGQEKGRRDDYEFLPPVMPSGRRGGCDEVLFPPSSDDSTEHTDNSSIRAPVPVVPRRPLVPFISTFDDGELFESACPVRFTTSDVETSLAPAASSSSSLRGMSSLGQRSRSEEGMRVRSHSTGHSHQRHPHHLLSSSPSASAYATSTTQLCSAVSLELDLIPPPGFDQIRSTLTRRSSFTQDSTPMIMLSSPSRSRASGKGSLGDSDKENSVKRNGALVAPQRDGSADCVPTRPSVGLTRQRSSSSHRPGALRDSTNQGCNSPLREARRAKSVPVKSEGSTLVQAMSQSNSFDDPSTADAFLFSFPPSYSSFASSSGSQPTRASPAESVTLTAAQASSSGPISCLKQRSQNALNLSPRLRRSDAAAFHSPARQGPKPRRTAQRSLAPPSPARPPSTPPILPSSISQSKPLSHMAPFSKSEPILPSSAEVGITPRESFGSPYNCAKASLPRPMMPISPLMRSVSLSNLNDDWSREWGARDERPTLETFDFDSRDIAPPVRQHRNRSIAPPIQLDDEYEGEDEQATSADNFVAQQVKRKRNKKTNSRMVRSCSSLSEILAGYQRPMLPVVSDSSHLDAISAETMTKLLAGEYSQFFDEVIIIDCRYPYEYNGGHIEGAINLPLVEDIDEHFPVGRHLPDRNKTAIVFHCEFSSRRGPEGLRHLRKLDREANFDRHPQTSYPHVYLLQGGYKGFFEASKGQYCTPVAYRTMRDPAFKDELQKWTCLSKRRSWKKQKSQSFACLSAVTGKMHTPIIYAHDASCEQLHKDILRHLPFD